MPDYLSAMGVTLVTTPQLAPAPKTESSPWAGIVTNLLGTAATVYVAGQTAKTSTALTTAQQQASNSQLVAANQAANAAQMSTVTKYALGAAVVAGVVLIGYMLTRKG